MPGSPRSMSRIGAIVATLVVAASFYQLSAQQNERVPLDIAGDASTRPWLRYAGWPTRDATKFNTLAVLVSPPAPTEPRQLAGPVIGDPAIGQLLVADRARGGSCLACHVMGPAGGAELPGNVGPDLSEIGNANNDDEWLFNFVYDARVFVDHTPMPPWGNHDIFNDADIGHIVAFLRTLKDPPPFKRDIDDPEKRPLPLERLDNLDPAANPAMRVVTEKAPALWKLAGPAGAACATCHAQSETTFKMWAATMPKWEPRLNKVLGVEEFLTRHAKATTGHTWLMESEENVALAVYLRYLANGAPIDVDVESPPSKDAYERGQELSLRKIGQLNFSCADCHLPERGALKWMRGQWLSEMRGQLDHLPTWRTGEQAIWDIRKRFQWCQVAVWANELPPDAKEYGDLELYLTAQSNGLKLNVPGIRD